MRNVGPKDFDTGEPALCIGLDSQISDDGPGELIA